MFKLPNLWWFRQKYKSAEGSLPLLLEGKRWQAWRRDDGIKA
jgi:hypothetical protein